LTQEKKLKFFFLGSVEKGVVEVTNCFCVPHKEHDDQVEAEIAYGADVFDLNRRVNASESIVGKFHRWIFSSLSGFHYFLLQVGGQLEMK
jgi:hypothetical protein